MNCDPESAVQKLITNGEMMIKQSQIRTQVTFGEDPESVNSSRSSNHTGSCAIENEEKRQDLLDQRQDHPSLTQTKSLPS